MVALEIVSGLYSVCRLPPGSDIPEWVDGSPFVNVTLTATELSVVCQADLVPSDVDSETGFRLLSVLGPLAFDAVGIISDITRVLAETGISVFVVSTYETDYVLVRETDLDLATSALRHSNYVVS